MLKSLFERMVPELVFFGTPEETRQAMQDAHKPIRIRFWLLVTLPFLCLLALSVIIALWTPAYGLVMRFLEARVSYPFAVLFVVWVLFWVLILFGPAMGSTLVFRGPIRRSLRRRLRERGLPICDVCGYDLRGCLSGCCPECGASFTPPDQPLDADVLSAQASLAARPARKAVSPSRAQWVNLIIGVVVVLAAVYRLIVPLDSWNLPIVAVMMLAGIIQIMCFVKPRWRRSSGSRSGGDLHRV